MKIEISEKTIKEIKNLLESYNENMESMEIDVAEELLGNSINILSDLINKLG